MTRTCGNKPSSEIINGVYFIHLFLIGSRITTSQNISESKIQGVANFSVIEHIRKCGMNDFQYGSWVDGAHLCGLKTHHVYDNGSRSHYCWQPLNCTAEKFSKEKFCANLNGRSILVVGDSVAKDFTTTMIHLMDSVITNKRDTVRVHEKICSGKSRISFMRNDHMTVRREGSPHHDNGDADSNLNWKSRIRPYDILVLHKGHHLTPLEGTDELFKRESLDTVNYIKNYVSPKKLIYFLTTSPPHPFCSKNSTPILTVVNQSHPAMYNITQYQDTIYVKKYNWHRIPYYNNYHKEIFRNVLNATIIDIEAMSMLRPDGHYHDADSDIAKSANGSDCLHYRSSNVYQNWVKIFYNLLSYS